MLEEEDYLKELEDIYSDADNLYGGSSCDLSTECCQFGITGREPYLTSIEWVHLQKNIPKELKRSLSKARKRKLPVVSDSEKCLLLTEEGKCATYENRPIGCRTFYCHRAFASKKVRHGDMIGLVRRIQELATRHEPRGYEGRKLSLLLKKEFEK